MTNVTHTGGPAPVRFPGGRRAAATEVALAAVVACATVLRAAPAAAQGTPPLVVEIEAGPVWQSYNDVEIPNDGTATRFSVERLVGSGPWAAGRLQVTWNVSEDHGLRLLLAPFSLAESGVSARAIDFAGASYAPGEPLEATYTFNSYRLTYRYRVHSGESTGAWIGVTAKIRDADIALRQGSAASEKSDVGFVPLLHLTGEWRLAPGWDLRLDADALAGGPGRAEDVSLTLGRELDEHWTVRTGYRMVEGGADVEDVYAFAWLHHAVVLVSWRP